MTWIDYVALSIVLLSTVIGVIRGFVKEMVSLLIWAAAVIIAVHYSAALSEIFAVHIHSPHVRLAISFVILMVITLLIGALINYLLNKMIEKGGATGTNRLVGLIFGLLRGLVIVAILLLFAHLTALPQSLAWQQSLVVKHFLFSAEYLKQLVPVNYIHYFEYMAK